jgi:hypothetical protein
MAQGSLGPLMADDLARAHCPPRAQTFCWSLDILGTGWLDACSRWSWRSSSRPGPWPLRSAKPPAPGMRSIRGVTAGHTITIRRACRVRAIITITLRLSPSPSRAIRLWARSRARADMSRPSPANRARPCGRRSQRWRSRRRGLLPRSIRRPSCAAAIAAMVRPSAFVR